MATSFLQQTAQPGDGAWLLQKGIEKRRRTRRSKFNSFLKRDEEDENEVKSSVEAAPAPQSFLQPPNAMRKERTSHAASPTDHGPPTMETDTPLSRTRRNSPVDSPQQTPHKDLCATSDDADKTRDHSSPFTTYSPASIKDGMAIPPHLRPKKAPVVPPSQASKDQAVKAEAASNQKDNNHTNPGTLNTKTRHEAGHDISPKDQWNQSTFSEEFQNQGVPLNQPGSMPTASVKPSLNQHLSSHEGVEIEKIANNKTSPKKAASSTANDVKNAQASTQATGAQNANDDGQSKRGGKNRRRHKGKGRADDPPPQASRQQWPDKSDMKPPPKPQPAKRSLWPKNSEMKPDPHRWDIKWVDDSSQNSIDSVCADSGWGDSKKKKGEGEVKLTGWDDDWAPPPLNWDSRPAFRDHQSEATIERWIEQTEREMFGTHRPVSTDEITAQTETYGEIAPRYWVPITLGRRAPQVFWSEFVKSDEPGTQDEGDLDGVKPFWELYLTKTSNILPPREPNEIKGIDPDETSNERMARENDLGSDQHTENRKRLEKAKRDAAREKRLRAKEKARRISEKLPALPVRETCKPGLNLYLRSAKTDDLPKILEIYNYYISFTTSVPEMEDITLATLTARFHKAKAHNFPFLVACERGQLLKPRRKRNDGEPILLPETIVGFAYADDYGGARGMYRFTAELFLFVHKDYYMKGVGTCLLDKLGGLLDAEYLERGGYDVEGDELEGLGPSRTISHLVMQMPYDRHQPLRLEWGGPWLHKFMGWLQVGNLQDVGIKNGKSVNIAVFQRKTGIEIDPERPPIMSSRLPD